ncbi:hypothetical protein KIK06_05675 [Nocardiopsis sp. EMB25]|uniref:hypothetical protein n=1 Tax=Nocardiopsis TaxID=2013 RepID=UPI000367D6E4|nr:MULTISPECIES: hypothetical protein [Nocardiopsis]MCY9783383.1 hypothetical protein [Nocardiopsis sp. EMB25]
MSAVNHTPRYLGEVAPETGEALAVFEGVTELGPGRILCSAVGLLHLSERGTLFRCPRGAVVVRNGQMITFTKLGHGDLPKTHV